MLEPFLKQGQALFTPLPPNQTQLIKLLINLTNLITFLKE